MFTEASPPPLICFCSLKCPQYLAQDQFFKKMEEICHVWEHLNTSVYININNLSFYTERGYRIYTRCQERKEEGTRVARKEAGVQVARMTSRWVWRPHYKSNKLWSPKDLRWVQWGMRNPKSSWMTRLKYVTLTNTNALGSHQLRPARAWEPCQLALRVWSGGILHCKSSSESQV